jgi:hypothetical protein
MSVVSCTSDTLLCMDEYFRMKIENPGSVILKTSDSAMINA